MTTTPTDATPQGVGNDADQWGMIDPFNRPLLPADRMARRLRLPCKWLIAEAEAGRLPHLKAGTKFLFVPSLIEKMLLERASKMPADAATNETEVAV